MFKYLILLACIGVSCLQSPNEIHATPLNGDFSSDLLSWTTSGDVQWETGSASLGDNLELYSLLYQGVSATNGSYTLTFDFQSGLSDQIPTTDPFAFPDVLFASVYFVDDISTFDPYNFSFDDSLALFDLDDLGPYNVNGTIGASSLGVDWQHFSATFNNTHQFIIPTFEFMDFNYIDNDSQVWIDNVQLSANTAPPVPEPSTGLLFFMGVATAISLQRRVKS